MSNILNHNHKSIINIKNYFIVLLKNDPLIQKWSQLSSFLKIIDLKVFTFQYLNTEF